MHSYLLIIHIFQIVLSALIVILLCFIYLRFKNFSEGQEETRTTKEDVEDTSGEGEKECWFGEGGCLESSKMENGSWRNSC